MISWPQMEGVASPAINRLPPDILMIIFNLLRPAPLGKSGKYFIPWDPIVISHICRYWRAVALNSPQFWSVIWYDECTMKVQSYLERSKNSGLKVDCRDRMAKSRNEVCNLTTLSEHMTRISELRVFLKSSGRDPKLLEKILSCLNSPAPKLVHLLLSSPTYSFSLPNVRISAPLLRTFQVERSMLHPDFTFPVNLVHLVLDSTRVSPNALFICLRSCPRLTTLFLEDVSWNEDFMPEENPASLHCLQKLVLKTPISSRELLGRICRSIELPDDLEWYCSIGYDAGNDSDSDEDLGDYEKIPPFGFVFDLLNAPFSCQNLKIMLSVSGVGLILECERKRGAWVDENPWEDDDPTDPNFCTKSAYLVPDDGTVNFTISSCLEGLSCLIKSTSLISVEYIDIDFTLNGVITVDNWFQILQSLPSVRFITLRDSGDIIYHRNAGNFAIALSRQVFKNNLFPEGSAICPKLEILLIERRNTTALSLFEVFIQDLQLGLRTRKQLGFGVHTLKFSPAKLIKEEELARLKECVGEFLEWAEETRAA